MSSDLREYSPSCERNRESILTVLKQILPSAGEGLVLEVASGTGQHSAWFGRALPHLRWQPSDLDSHLHPSIEAWATHEGATNVRTPLVLDVTSDEWPQEPFDSEVVAIFNANMIHISPWRACEGLLSKAADLLASGRHLFMYGPYTQGGVHTAPSNESFDQSLRTRNPDWGIRDLEDVIACARAYGLEHAETIEMPANNLSVIYRRR